MVLSIIWLSHPHVMSEPQLSSTSTTSHARGTFRTRSRGGLGKYLRARGRGRRGGYTAEFQERPGELDEAEAEAEAHRDEARYAKRTLDTNASRYEEAELEIGHDGMISRTPLDDVKMLIVQTGQAIEEPDVDLSEFLAQQRLKDLHEPPLIPAPVEDDDVDHAVAHLTSNTVHGRQSRKGKVRQIEWDTSLEEMQHDKNVAQAHSGA
jgi:hypothetical protein